MTTPVTKILTLVMISLCLLAQGCSETPAFDPSTQYTPESLAQELAFRARTVPLPTKAGAAKQKSAVSVASKSASTKPDAKDARAASAQTKKALATTLDEVVQETVDKFSQVNGMAKADIAKKVAASIANDASLSQSLKDEIQENLTRLSSNL